MRLQIFHEFWSLAPVLDTPIIKVPLIHVIITFIVDIVDETILDIDYDTMKNELEYLFVKGKLLSKGDK